MISKKGKNLGLLMVGFLIVFGVVARFLPHPPNFAPIAALALFGATYLPKKFALWVPIGAMLISDIFIGFYALSVMFSVYGSFFLISLLGLWLRKHRRWFTVVGSAIFGAFLFFAITNFAVWFFTPLYQRNLSGFFQCYLMALPFFKNTLLGDLFYATCFFGLYEIVFCWIKKKFSIPSGSAELLL